MSNGTFLETHLFRQKQPRRFEQDGRIVLLLHCDSCSRDFLQTGESPEWHAAYVGIFRVEPLLENLVARWVDEPCPGRRLESDEDDRARRL
jgi:hypothetical protein